MVVMIKHCWGQYFKDTLCRVTLIRSIRSSRQSVVKEMNCHLRDSHGVWYEILVVYAVVACAGTDHRVHHASDGQYRSVE